MSLLREIQEAVVSDSVNISVLLHKCKVLTARLGNIDFKQWIEYELNGYPSKEGLPRYRIVKVESCGNFLGIGWSQYHNAPIPPSCIPEELRDLITTKYPSAPISLFSQNMGPRVFTYPDAKRNIVIA